MKVLLPLLLVFVLSAGSLVAQTDSSATDNLPNADTFHLENDFAKHVSLGWFPKPFAAHSYFFGSTFRVGLFNHTHDLRSSSFSPTRFSFQTDKPFEKDEDLILEKNSSNSATDKFPGEGYNNETLGFSVNIPPLHSILRCRLGYDRNRSRLYSLDTTKSFLTDNGTLQSFKEVSVLFTNQHYASFATDLLVPIYGAFLESEMLSTSSFYYVGIGAQASYVFIDENTQYTQIANAKDKIRFSNGMDTVTTMDKQPYRTTNLWHYNIEPSIGWHVSFLGAVMFDFEAFLSIPMTSVLSDAKWYQYRYGLRMAIGYENN